MDNNVAVASSPEIKAPVTEDNITNNITDDSGDAIDVKRQL